MILDDQPRPPAQRIAGHATLDDLFRRAVAEHPDALALVDPPDRARTTDGIVRRLTYAQADRMVSALAARLIAINLNVDDIVGLQLANTVESVLVLLAVLRAGLVAMPLPLLWRRDAMVAALRQAGAKALIVCGRIGATDHFGLAIEAAADVFAVRQVCGFGREPPDGVTALDDIDEAAAAPAGRERSRAGHPSGAHLAVITWDTASDGLVPVARSHAEVIAGGLAVLLESRFRPNAAILSTIPPGSFAAIATALVPWLLVGGTLVLHHPFDAAVFAEQLCSLRCSAAVVPGPLLPRLADARLLSADDLASVVANWRAPEQCSRAPALRDDAAAVTDVQIFGESGLIAARRDAAARPAVIPLGSVLAPRGADGALTVVETAATARRTLALRGPMVPRRAFPPGAERTAVPHLKSGPDGFVDTGYACELDPSGAAMTVVGAPAGLASCGGYRFAVRALDDTIRRPRLARHLGAAARCARRPTPGRRNERSGAPLPRAAEPRRQPVADRSVQGVARRRGCRVSRARRGTQCCSADPGSFRRLSRNGRGSSPGHGTDGETSNQRPRRFHAPSINSRCVGSCRWCCPAYSHGTSRSSGRRRRKSGRASGRDP